MTVHEHLIKNGFFYNKSGSSMSKTGTHKLDPIIADAYVKFRETQTEVYKQIGDSWNHLILNTDYDVVLDENLTETELLEN
jgi:hypothetical protein